MSTESKQERFDRREKKRAIINTILWVVFVLAIIGGVAWFAVSSDSQGDQVAVAGSLEEVTDKDHLVGNLATAKVILVEYSDFECPACAKYEPVIQNLTKTYEAKGLVFAYRHFPLTQHLRAIPASRASEAAGMQGKFWEMHHQIFASQDEWSKLSVTEAKDLYISFAKELGLNMRKFEADMAGDKVMVKIQADLLSGRQVELAGTPTFFLNGQEINPRTEADFIKLIDDALKTYDQTTNNANSTSSPANSR